MLQSIRDRAQGWVAWFIVSLISIPFALWGIQEYLGVGSLPPVATINGIEISERELDGRYREYRQQLRQQLGNAYRPDLFDEEVLRKETLEAMIQSELIVQKSDDLGMKAGNTQVIQAIMNISAFQIDGRFKKDSYERTLRSQGMNPKSFEQRMSHAIVSEQLQKAISESNWVTDAELSEVVRLRRQLRTYEFLILPAADYMNEIDVSDTEIQTYYAANSNLFISPEQVKLDYLELNLDSIVGTLEVKEEDLITYYESNRKKYLSPERRKASHILFLAEEGADTTLITTAEKNAQDALLRLENGEDFATLAQELSEDPGSAKQGGDLGFFAKGVMDTVFEEAAFGLAEGAMSIEPIRSSYGFHLIKLIEIEQEAGKSFEEVREEVTEAQLKIQAERVLYEYAEQLGDLAYEDSDSLEPAAAALGIKIKRTHWIARKNTTGLFKNLKLLNAAFSEDVLSKGNNSEVIELTSEHMIVLRVDDHKESSAKPLQEVSAEIKTTLKAIKASAKAGKSAATYLAQMNAGETTLKTLAAELAKEIQLQTDASRNGSAPREVVKAAFRLATPVNSALVNGDVEMPNGDFALISLSKVIDGDMTKLSDPEKQQLRTSLSRTIGLGDYQHLLKNLRDQGEIEIKLPKSSN